MMRVGVKQGFAVLHDANMTMPENQITALQLRLIINAIADMMLRAGIARRINAACRQG